MLQKKLLWKSKNSNVGILIDKNSRVVCQGITGSAGSFHTRLMIEYGTNIVAGVTPGKKCDTHQNVPLFTSVSEAERNTGANISIIFVPAVSAKDAVFEAAEAGIELIVCITEGMPVSDLVKIKKYFALLSAATGKATKLIGPNCPGIITPEESKVGIMPGYIHKKGNIGIVSRSGTLTYEAVHQLTNNNLGQSTCIGIGGDQIIGTSFTDVLKLFEDDNDTDLVVLIGEIGGSAEEEAAEFIKNSMTKPVVGFIAGRTAPKEKRMGHAGAIISDNKGTAKGKIDALKEAGVIMVENPANIGKTVLKIV